MLFEGQFKIGAPIQQVWDSLLNPKVLAACVPGCEMIEIIDERTYDCIVAAKVGSISVRFKFTTKLSDIEPPKHLKATGNGADIGKAGTFTQETIVDLEEVSNSDVQVSYRSNVNIAGKLATFGDRIMKAKAAQVQEEFTKSLAKRLADESGAAATTGRSTASTATSEPSAATSEAHAPRSETHATPGQKVAVTSSTQIKVSFWEMIAVFFSVLWDKTKSLFRRSKT